MSVRNTGKRKRSDQPTLLEIFERQRVLQRSEKTRSINMTDMIEVNSSQEEEAKLLDKEIETQQVQDISTVTKNELENTGETSMEESKEVKDNDNEKSTFETNLETQNLDIGGNLPDISHKTEEIDAGNGKYFVETLTNDEDKSLPGDNMETLKDIDSEMDEESLEIQKDEEDNLIRVNQEASNIDEENRSFEGKNESESSFDDKEDILPETIVERTDKETSSDTSVKVQANGKEKSFEEDVETKKESNEDTQVYELSLQESQSSIDGEPVRLGVEFDTLLRAPGCCGRNKTLSPGPMHTILFRPYQPSQPYPSKYRDKWDRFHVRMPCSKENLYPCTDGKTKLLSRWELIRRSLKAPMVSSYDLQEAILSYNSHYAQQWNFRMLHIFLVEKVSQEENKEFFNFILPGIIRLALRLPEICTQAVPLLKRQQEHTITMTQQQAASLLANAFLCTFPRRNSADRNGQHEFRNYPDINFNRLFQLNDHKPSQKKVEKLKCIFHYFKRVLKQPPCGTISYKRQVLKPDETPKWHSCSTKLCRLRVCSDGTIEDNAPGMLQADFANKFVGGGVLGQGCVQEEIRFIICPELIVSRLFTEGLEDNECLIVTGAERFSDYVGYARTFQWAGNHDEQSIRDSWGRFHTEIVAIDAKPGMTYSEQFSPANLKRELEKAYCGFLSRHSVPEHLPAVATGKWGCGAFNGDPQLKSLIQIMAASVAHRDVFYLTFNAKEHAEEVYDIHSILKNADITVGVLWKMLNQYKKQLSSEAPIHRDLFGYIRGELGTSDEQNDVTDSTLDANSVSSSPLLFEDSQDTKL